MARAPDRSHLLPEVYLAQSRCFLPVDLPRFPYGRRAGSSGHVIYTLGRTRQRGCPFPSGRGSPAGASWAADASRGRADARPVPSQARGLQYR